MIDQIGVINTPASVSFSDIRGIWIHVSIAIRLLAVFDFWDDDICDLFINDKR